MNTNYQLIFSNRGLQREYPEGSLILDILKSENILLSNPCNGQGTCGKCRIKLSGELAPPTFSEIRHIEPVDLASGIRLACQTRVQGNLIIELPEFPGKNGENSSQILSSSIIRLPVPAPLYQVVTIPEPVVVSWENIVIQLPESIKPTLNFLQQIPGLPKDSGKLWVQIFDGRAIEISITVPAPKFGVAVDIGTTTLAAYLVDLTYGRIVKTFSAFNPQTNYGADIISRIIYAEKPEGLQLLHDLIIQAINGLVSQLADISGIRIHDILQVNLVGNTCMSHLLLKVNPHSLGALPFSPVFEECIKLSPVELGLNIHKEGSIYLLPGIGGFIGSDITVGIMASNLSSEKTEILLDIGTNGEMVIAGKGQMLACSTAAGPAFEGAKISCGMLAKPGAITDVQLNPGKEPVLITLNNLEPQGICGTGLIRILVEFLKNEIVTETGAFNPKISDPNYDPILKRYCLFRGPNKAIFVTQQDIREFQLAKGAIRAGLEILIKKIGISYSDINTVYLAGAFGTYMNPDDAVFLGLLPPIDSNRIQSVGNTAGMGAAASVVSYKILQHLTKVVQKVEHIELAGSPDFTTVFTEAMLF